jgi:hypothetical protein
MNLDDKKLEFLSAIEYQEGLPLRERRYSIQLHADPRVFNDVETMIKAMEINTAYGVYASDEVKKDLNFRLNFLALTEPPLEQLPTDYTDYVYVHFHQNLHSLWNTLPKDEYRLAVKEAIAETLQHQYEIEDDLER